MSSTPAARDPLLANIDEGALPSTAWSWLKATVESSADGILVFDTEYRVTVWSRGMERISGIPAAGILGRSALEAFPFLIETGEDALLREALAGRPAVSRDRPYAVPETNRQGFFEAYYTPVYGADGRIAGGLAIVRDVTERRRAEQERFDLARAEAARAEAEAAARRFAFLAEAGEVLSSSLDFEQTLRDVARLCLPELGDMCVVDVVENGRIQRLAATHVRPEKAILLEELRRRYPPTLDSPQPAARVLRSGQPELLVDTTDEVVAAHTHDAAHAALIRAIDVRSHLAVPLVARGATVGMLSLGITESDRRYGPADEALARELARRAALAVDNARLYRTAQNELAERRRAEEALRLLADAGELLGASLDARLTLQNLTRVIVPRFADLCAVDLIGESGELERVSVSDLRAERAALALELFERFPPRRDDPLGPWHRVATGEPAWAEAIDDSALQSVAQSSEHLAMLRAVGMRSFLCVPLIARSGPIGVLSLLYTESGRRYGPADVELAKDLARRLAIAVENARLYERLRVEDQRKDEFLATLAHELRNPLAPIRTGLEILRQAESPAQAENTRRIMERQLGHMVRLIDDLLDLSRVSQGKVQLREEPVDVGAIVATALEVSGPVVEAAGLELFVRLPAEPVLLQADRTRLSQVLSNLLNNAAKYTERGGRVELDVRREGGSVIMAVKDTGIGIPRPMLPHVFEMFVQVGQSLERSQGGLGIGLTLVRRLVELHGGEVWAESDGPGQGSAFFVRLPLAATVTPSPPPARESVRPARARRRVLLVDDNRDAVHTLAMLLELEGHEVRTATSGPAALELVESFRPDVAVLDIGMPGMNGYELAGRLRANPALAGIKLIALTGWGQAEYLRRSMEAGFAHHLTKPVDPREVSALVEAEQE